MDFFPEIRNKKRTFTLLILLNIVLEVLVTTIRQENAVTVIKVRKKEKKRFFICE